ncbi:MAG TPA: PGPGW domain-containing protein [Alphaproteobacteria bacterium]|nr:PGPGW domain-containing protein [Alphaproteobacteria bacterium]
MTVHAKTVGLALLGWTFVLLGVAGLFLPFLQGFLFLFVGLIILARVHTWARALVVRSRRRFPAVNRGYGYAQRLADDWRRRARRLFRR